MKIAVDLDEVLGDFVGAFLRWHNHRFETNWVREDIVQYHIEDIMGISRDEARKRIYSFLDEEVSSIPLVEGAQEAVKVLTQNHKLYVISARHSCLKLPTQQWLERYFPGVFEGLYLTQDGLQDGDREKTKGEICKQLGCEILIDDGSQHVEPLLVTGVQVIIFNHPWNIYHRFPPSVKRANNWREIVEAVNKLAKA